MEIRLINPGKQLAHKQKSAQEIWLSACLFPRLVPINIAASVCAIEVNVCLFVTIIVEPSWNGQSRKYCKAFAG